MLGVTCFRGWQWGEAVLELCVGPNMKEQARFWEGSGMLLEAVSGDGDLAINFRHSTSESPPRLSSVGSFFSASKPFIYRMQGVSALRFLCFCKP
jgi:hypothetical protein